MKRKFHRPDTDLNGRVRRGSKPKTPSSRTMVVRFIGGPLNGRSQTVSISTYRIDVGVIPFWTYVRTQKRAGSDGAITFMKLPTQRWQRKLMPRVKG